MSTVDGCSMTVDDYKEQLALILMQSAALHSLPSPLVKLIGDYTGGPSGLYVHVYNISHDYKGVYRLADDHSHWKHVTNVPSADELICSARLATYFVATYRPHDETIGNAVQVFDLARREWRTIAPMLTRRDLHAIVSWKTKEREFNLAVLGGVPQRGVKELSSVEFYDGESNTWALGPSMLSRRSAPAVVVVDDVIYVFGGNGLTVDEDDAADDDRRSHTLCTAERFENGKWSSMASSTIAGAYHIAVHVSGTRKIRLLGGAFGSDEHGDVILNIMEEYDIDSNTYRLIDPNAYRLPFPDMYATTAHYDPYNRTLYVTASTYIRNPYMPIHAWYLRDDDPYGAWKPLGHVPVIPHKD